MTVIRNNHVLGGPSGSGKWGSRRERALRRLRDPQAFIEVKSGEGLHIENFVCGGKDDGSTPLRDFEYLCTGCGAHVITRRVRVEGQVTCPCGLMRGAPL